MNERRRHSRVKPSADQRLLTLHGTRGHVCGRAEDESESGLGVHVRHSLGLEPGQTVLIHRMHEDQLAVGTIRHLSPGQEEGTRLGIEILSDRPAG